MIVKYTLSSVHACKELNYYSISIQTVEKQNVQYILTNSEPFPLTVRTQAHLKAMKVMHWRWIHIIWAWNFTEYFWNVLFSLVFSFFTYSRSFEDRLCHHFWLFCAKHCPIFRHPSLALLPLTLPVGITSNHLRENVTFGITLRSME